MDEVDCLKQGEEKLKLPSAMIHMSEDRDPEELREGILCRSCLSTSTQDSLQLEDIVDRLTDEILDESMKLVELEVQLENAGVFWGPHVDGPMAEADLGQLPGSCVEFAGEEIQVQVLYLEEERDQDVPQEEKTPVREVQTKSWLRRQAGRLWKGMKLVGNFCLGVMRCQGLKRCMREVVRSDQVLPF